MDQDSSPAIGIDLGTTFCCVGFLNSNNHVDIFDNDHGHRTTPSYLIFKDNKVIVGKSAKDEVFRNPENVIYDSKRLIGRKFSDEYVQQNLKIWSFNISPGNDDSPLIQIRQDETVFSYHPHEISAKLLVHMKNVAEKRLGKEVKNAVVTVPAHFNYHQRTATAEAGKIAGLNVLKIMNEPTAAVLAYVHKHEISNCENILVFDLGGGTLDVSIVSVKQKVITVKATSGNTHLGGRDFDNNLTTFVVQQIKKLYNTDVTDKKRTMQRINGISENIKNKLSFANTVYFDFPSFLHGEDVYIEVSRGDFEKINIQLFSNCLQAVKNCLEDAKIKKEQIEKILLVGGSTRIPKIQEILSDFFDGKKDLVSAINADEAVAYGAAVQASMFQKCGKEEILWEINDVTPLSLGLGSFDHLMEVVIPRNSSIPITRNVDRITVMDKQTDITFKIFEGERPLVKYNTKIGVCTLTFPQKPPGYTVNVSFHVNANGILDISAKTDTGSYVTLTVHYEKQSAQRTNDILQDALENENSDKKKINVINQWKELNDYCTKMKAICAYDKKGMKEEEKNAIITKVTPILDWVNNNPVENGTEEEISAIVKKFKEIETTCEPIVTKYDYKLRNMSLDDFYILVTQ